MPVIRTDRGPVAVLEIDNPGKLNALSLEILGQIAGHLDAIEEDDAVRAVVITGAGGVFAAGADIGFMKQAGRDEVERFAAQGQEMMDRVESFPKPVIAAIGRFALGGGCELALACDIRVAADDAKLGQPEVNLGIMPGWGGTQRLPWLTNPGFAKDLIFTGRHVGAAEAAANGLVQHVVPADEVVERAVAIGELIAQKAPLAVRSSKLLVNLTTEGDVQGRLQHERTAFIELFGTEDRTEGMGAFFEKRTPTFKGR